MFMVASAKDSNLWKHESTMLNYAEWHMKKTQWDQNFPIE